MVFSAEGLPEGLALDNQTGIITGTIADKTKRSYETTLIAENGTGKDHRAFQIFVGDTLALTPPMGWNHWYAHYDRITDAMMREAADILLSSGMADVGYQYVNIDDCWPNREEHADPKRVGPFRDEDGNVLTNQYFPDMNAMTDYIHGLGLKAGIYTSPGPKTCAGFAGAYQHEEQDARQFAAWGFDFLKYDWCSYGEIAKKNSLPELKKPYILMGDILKTLDRDIVLNLCQYGMGDVWTWGQEVGGHCWRTAGDLGFELQRYHGVAQRNAEHHEYAGPGAWNDPDYLLLGYVGAASEMGEPVPCTLTGNEQYSYMSLWSLMAAPLFYSGDMTRLDEFTLNVICNAEVIAINQDPLGKQGYPVVKKGDAEIWTKPLHDGSLAVGLFNLAEVSQEVQVNWAKIGLTGKQEVRDLWRQTDLGEFEEGFSAPLGRHDVALLRVGP
jgi:alpha-galactosidase